MTDGAPSRALREIHRSPVTATMFMATTSHRVRDVMRPLIFRVMPLRCASRAASLVRSISRSIVVLHFGKRAFPAAVHDRKVALEARPFAFAALLARSAWSARPLPCGRHCTSSAIGPIGSPSGGCQ